MATAVTRVLGDVILCPRLDHGRRSLAACRRWSSRPGWSVCLEGPCSRQCSCGHLAIILIIGLRGEGLAGEGLGADLAPRPCSKSPPHPRLQVKVLEQTLNHPSNLSSGRNAIHWRGWGVGRLQVTVFEQTFNAMGTVPFIGARSARAMLDSPPCVGLLSKSCVITREK